MRRSAHNTVRQLLQGATVVAVNHRIEDRDGVDELQLEVLRGAQRVWVTVKAMPDSKLDLLLGEPWDRDS